MWRKPYTIGIVKAGCTFRADARVRGSARRAVAVPVSLRLSGDSAIVALPICRIEFYYLLLSKLQLP